MAWKYYLDEVHDTVGRPILQASSNFEALLVTSSRINGVLSVIEARLSSSVSTKKNHKYSQEKRKKKRIKNALFKS